MNPPDDIPFGDIEPAQPAPRHRETPAPRHRETPAPRVTPCDETSERQLLGACMVDEAVIASAQVAGCTEASFFTHSNRLIFRAIIKLKNDGVENPDAATVVNALKDSGDLEAVGGWRRVGEVSSTAPTAAFASQLIAKVREVEMRRALAILGDQLAEHSRNGISLDDLRGLVDAALPALEVKRADGDGFTLWKPSQFLAFQVDPAACLLGPGYVELGQWTSFIGIGGLGKTRLALWLAICQILGRPWCNIPTNGKPQRTVILSTENGIRRWKGDLEKMLPQFTDVERALLDDHLLIMAMTPEEDGDMCIGNPITVRRLEVTLKGCNPGFVIFDPFADMVDGDENKAVDLVQTLRVLRGITQSCCPTAAVLIIHHARTGAANVGQAGDNFNAGNFGRGSKTLYSKVRCEMQLAPQDRDNSDRFVLACGKANDCPKFDPRCVVFNSDRFSYSIDPDFDIDAWRNDVAGKQKQCPVSMAEIVQSVADKSTFSGAEVSQKDIYDFFAPSGASIRTLQRHITDAVDSGYLRRGKLRYMLKLGAKPLPKN